MRKLSMLLIFVLLILSCKDRVICPAFQSSFILDDSVRSVYYSYLWKIDEEERIKYLSSIKQQTDTSLYASLDEQTGVSNYFEYTEQYLVKERPVKKTRFGIIKKEPLWLKRYHWKTAPMENVLTPPAVDTTLLVVDEGEFFDSDFGDNKNGNKDGEADTTDAFVLPSLARTPPPKEKPPVTFKYGYDPEDPYMNNVDQLYYNKYFIEQLIGEPQPEVEVLPEPKKEKKGWWIFGRKKDKTTDEKKSEEETYQFYEENGETQTMTKEEIRKAKKEQKRKEKEEKKRRKEEQKQSGDSDSEEDDG